MNRLRTLAIAAVTAVIAVGIVAPTTAAATSRGASTALRAPGTHYATEQPTCAAAVSGHASCFAIRRVPASKATPGAKPYTVTPDVATGLAGGYTPDDIAHAYNVTPTGGAGQTVAIVDAFDDPTVASDLAAFDSHYGFHAEKPSTFEQVNELGTPSPLPAADPAWAAEETLDVQAVRGLCHQCRIVLVEAASISITDLATATNTAAAMGATVISNSYGFAENDPSITPTVISDYNHQRVAITAAAGEDGWDSWDVANNGSASSNEPNAPASLPTVVSVGGTSLYLNSDGSYGGETVWNGNGLGDVNGRNAGSALGASGGGCSTVSLADAWQEAVAGWANTGCGNNRLASDVSAVADPLTGYDVYQTYGTAAPGWETLGGTSLSAPVIAAMYALAGGAHRTPYPSLDLYGHVSTSAVHDVVIGGTGYCDNDSATHCAAASGGNPNTLGFGQLDCAFAPTGTTVMAATGACDATKGYDGPSGVGTPDGLAAFTPVSLGVTIKAERKSRTKYSFSAKVSDPTRGGTKTLHYLWQWKDGSPESEARQPTHKFHGTGKHRIKLVMFDSYNQTGHANVAIKVKRK
jgi:hypothetical protein